MALPSMGPGLRPLPSYHLTSVHLCDNVPYVVGKRVSRIASQRGRQDTSAPKVPIVGGQGVPKNLLVPWILLLLKQWSAHGYLLMQTLNKMGLGAVDHAMLYRELRNLERQKLVTSAWETDGYGPAKRRYMLTEAGEEFLRSWANTVAGYQRMFTGFFELYTQVLGGGSSQDDQVVATTPSTPSRKPKKSEKSKEKR